MYANGIAPQRLDNTRVKLDECALVNDKTAINRGLYAGAKKVRRAYSSIDVTRLIDPLNSVLVIFH